MTVVRMTVKEGGNARIYPKRRACFTGWSFIRIATSGVRRRLNLMAAQAKIARCVITERESFLAQRLRYDVQYYDKYVWGGEVLIATVTGRSPLITVGFGVARVQSVHTMIGRRIATDIGAGLIRTVGRG
jgi:hypothetical protein